MSVAVVSTWCQALKHVASIGANSARVLKDILEKQMLNTNGSGKMTKGGIVWRMLWLFGFCSCRVSIGQPNDFKEDFSVSNIYIHTHTHTHTHIYIYLDSAAAGYLLANWMNSRKTFQSRICMFGFCSCRVYIGQLNDFKEDFSMWKMCVCIYIYIYIYIVCVCVCVCVCARARVRTTYIFHSIEKLVAQEKNKLGKQWVPRAKEIFRLQFWARVP